MRPVERGPWPLDAAGQPKVYHPYRAARDDLIERLGDYCSFCELPIPNPDVEHMAPKSLDPAREEEWANFLLACTWCNSTKGNKDTDALDLYWPDRDNTLRAFVPLHGGRLRVNWRLSAGRRARAQVTADVVGLLRYPGGSQRPTSSDRRWLKRKEAWDKAVRLRSLLAQRDDALMRRTIVEAAAPTGFLAVWLRVFSEDADMRGRLVAAFRGTARSAFDAAWRLRHRGEL